MAEVGQAYLTILPSVKGIGSKISQQAGGELDKAGAEGGERYGATFGNRVSGKAAESGHRFGTIFTRSSLGPLKAFGEAAVAIFAVDKVKDFFQESIGLARQQQKTQALTAQVIKTTGGAANVTAKQVADLSDRMSENTGISELNIAAGEKALLTFTNIRNEVGKGNDIFNKASKAALNLSAGMGINLTSATRAVGRALNDPIKGTALLTRYGITLSASQTKNIKTFVAQGKTLDAQKIILGTLATRFGGAAKASTTMGQKVSNSYEEIKKKIGTALLPALDSAERALLRTLFPALGKISSYFTTTIAPVLRQFGEYINKNIVPAVQAFAAKVGPPLVAALKEGFGFIKTDVVPVLLQVYSFIDHKLIPAIAELVSGALKNFRSAIKNVSSEIQKNRPQLTELFNAIRKIATAVLIVAVPALKILTKYMIGNMAKSIAGGIIIIGTLVRAFNGIARGVKAAYHAVSSAISSIVHAVSSGTSKVVNFFSALPHRITSAIGDLGGLLYNAGRAVLTGFLSGLKDAFAPVQHFVSGIAGWIKGNKGPIEVDRVLLHPAGVAIMEGLINGLASKTSALTAKLKEITRSISQSGGSDAFKNHWNDAVTAVSKRLDTIITKFKAVKSEAADLSSEISSNLISGADLSNAGTSTVAGGIGFLKSENVGLKAFEKNLALMRKKGFAPALVNQIASEGLDDGGPLAAQYAHATAAQVKTIDRLEKSIGSTSRSIGQSAAAATYNPQLEDLKKETRKVRRAVEHIGRDIVHAERGVKRSATLKAKSRTGSRKP